MKRLLLTSLAIIATAKSAPIPQAGFYPMLNPMMIPIPLHNIRPQNKDIIGDWIMGSDWFPIEFNVPDAFNSLGQNFQSGVQNVQAGLANFGNGFNMWWQNLPFINRISTQFRPRPNNNYLILVPAPIKNHPVGQNVVNFNPFEHVAEFIPHVP